jgi:hypothetical protein
LWFLFLLCTGVAVAIVVVKHARRRLRYVTRDPRRVAAACARELAEYLHDQRMSSTRASTFHELSRTIAEQLGVDASEFARAATNARYGRLDQAQEAAGNARRELRELKRKLRRSLVPLDRARGLVSVRSLGLG